MKKLFIYLFIFLGTSLIAQQSSNEEGKIWSRVKPDDNNLKGFIVNDGYNYIPSNVGFQIYNFKSTRATVYPNFRPWPTTNTTQSELSVDVHPNNLNIVIGSANATPSPVGGVIYGTGTYWTLNGGATWAGADDPPYGRNSGDPAAVIGLNGYFSVGFIDAGTNDGGQGVAVSSNNGATWSRYVAGPRPVSSADLLDKNHLMVDKKASSPYVNRLYAAWTRFITGDPHENEIELKYSADNGATWSASKYISSGVNAGSHDQGINIQTGPNGQAYAAWAVYDNWGAGVYGEDAIGFNTSTDGGDTWGPGVRIYSAANFGIRGNIKSTSIRVSSFPSMAVDRTGGSTNGYIYITFPMKGVAPAGSDPDIALIRSTDGGTTWSAPKRVNNDPMNNGKDQYYPWMTVDQSTGHLYVLFYDSRNVHNDSAEVYLARSIDGGNSFENIKVSDAKFKPKTISGLASGYQGDYIGVAALNNTVYCYWMEDRTGIYQAWMAKVTFGPNLVHKKLTNTENLTGPYKVGVRIESALPLNPNRLKVYWGRNSAGTITDSITLTQATADSFYANIPGNGTPSHYSYYIYAEDSTGGFSSLPAGAPNNYYTFEANTDLVPPEISHLPLPNQFRETWPATVHANVTDNIGVDSVKVIYQTNSTRAAGSFYLNRVEGDHFAGIFNVDTSVIAVGDTMKYRIAAKDISVAGNWGYDPSSTTFHEFVFKADSIFPVIAHNPLRDQAKVRWPAKVKAVVSDNIGVANVKCEYALNAGTPAFFTLTNVNGDLYEGYFPIDTSAIVAGDSIVYRIIAEDNSTSHNKTFFPQTGFLKFKIINTLGIILVVDDDVAVEGRTSPFKGGGPEIEVQLGSSANLFAQTLNEAGYVVDTVRFTNLDVGTLDGYDVVILSAGPRTTAMFDDLGKRTAIVNYTLNGGRTLVEGGEVGYIYRKSGTTTDKDPFFRRNVLHDSVWVSDVTTGLLRKIRPMHSIFNSPNFVPDSLTFSGTGFGPRDAMRTTPGEQGIFKLAGWYPTYLDTAGILAYSPGNHPDSLRNIFFTFSVSNITNTQAAKNLIENTFQLFMNWTGFVPVELASFSANVDNRNVVLGWETVTEKNNQGFAIERKLGDGNFEKVGFVQGKGTTLERNNYAFIDADLNEGQYSYRLKQIDYDGTTSYSDVVEIEIALPKVFALEQNYPNPFNPSTKIKYSIPVDGVVTLELFNALGEKIATLFSEKQTAGNYTFEFNASNVPSGIYFYKLSSVNQAITKKMILLK